MAETEIISSGENNNQFFEGVEKLIEIWFTPAKNADLRKITRYVHLFIINLHNFVIKI